MDLIKAFLLDLFSSVGVKRTLVGWIQTLAALAQMFAPTIPFLGPIANFLTQVAAWLGGVALVHATVKRTLSASVISTIGTIFAIAAVAAQYVPFLAPYADLLNDLAKLFGAATVGVSLGEITAVRKTAAINEAYRAKAASNLP